MDERKPLATRGSFVTRTWYVAAWSDELKAGNVVPRTILGRNVLLYRTAGGSVVALDDRCPHRAAPLSLGQVEGENVRCLYHGLLFGPNGSCVEHPAQPHPPRLAVRAYPVRERQRLVWIWCGESGAADAVEPLEVPWLESAEWRGITGYMHYRAGYQLIADNLLDFSHSAYVHRTTFGSPAVASARQSFAREGNAVRVVRHLPGMQPLPFHVASGAGAGLVDMWQEYDWICPSVMSMDSGSAPIGTGALEGNRGQANIRFRHLTFLTPETENTTHYFFIQLRAFRLDEEELDEVVHRQMLTAFDEDRVMIEAQQKNIEQAPSEPLAILASDRGVVLVRRIINEMLDGEPGEPTRAQSR